MEALSTPLSLQPQALPSESVETAPANDGAEIDRRCIVMVSRSESERLLSKFFDALEYDFEHEKSSLWSPPVSRKVVLTSPGFIVCSDDYVDERVKRLKVKKKKLRKKKDKEQTGNDNGLECGSSSSSSWRRLLNHWVLNHFCCLFQAKVSSAAFFGKKTEIK